MIECNRIDSLTFLPVAECPAALKSPFTTAPDANLIAAQALAYRAGLVPADFRGRVGLLLTASKPGSALCASIARTPMSEGEKAPWETLENTAVWPRLEEADCEGYAFPNGRGDVKTLTDMLAELFAPFPDRDDDHGGREQRERRAKWRGLMVAAARTPSVRLLAAFNRGEAGAGRPVALTEWWAGEAPAWQVRYDRSFIAPSSGARYLFDWMLEGIPHEAQDVICRDERPVLPVIYEDEAMVAVNKPARLASVVGGRESVSAESLLNERYGKVHVVHRLDMGTSGVLVFAKKPDVLKALNAAFRARDVEKHYVARLEGRLDPARLAASGEIELPLMLDWFERPKQCVFPLKEGAREALTRVSWAGEEKTVSGVKTLVNLSPVTGRTHQLRLHCAHPEGLGLAIDGDPFYASAGLLNESPARRLCLHAAGVEFRHPLTGDTLRLWADAHFPDF